MSQEQLDKVLEMINSGISQGAKLECGGRRKGNKGYFVEPTVFSNVDSAMRIAQEEVGGINMGSCFNFFFFNIII